MTGLVVGMNLLFAALNAACIVWLLEVGEPAWIGLNIFSLIVNLAGAAYCAAIGWD